MARRQGVFHRLANAITVWAILRGIPRPPYTRNNGIVIETAGRRSGKRYRIPAGYLEEEGKLIVVVEHGERADWVRNALAGGLRVHHRGTWRNGRLRLLDGDPEAYLGQMNRLHAQLVRWESSTPGVVEISFE